MRNESDWAESTRLAHGVLCQFCGRRTFTKSGICPPCKRQPKFLDPATLPEDYLTACAHELMRRREERDRLLVKLGIKPAEAA